MRPTSGSAIRRPDLGIVVLAYAEAVAQGYIGLQLMPIYKTPEKSSTFMVIPKEQLLSIQDTARASGGAYGRDDFEYERGKYATSEHGWETPIDDSERNLFEREAPGMADQIATQRAWDIILRGQEKRIAGKVFNAGNFTAHPVGNEWSKAALGTPITDVKDAKAAFRRQCGMDPDAMALGNTAFENLRNNAQIVDRIKYTFPGIQIADMNASQLAQALGVPQVLVGKGVYNSAKKGQAAVIADIWDDEYAALVKISSGPDTRRPGLGRTYLWTTDSPDNPIVEQYREEQIRSDVYRVRHAVDEALMRSVDDTGATVSDIAAQCVYLLSNITE